MKDKWAEPEYRAKALLSLRGQRTTEHKAKISDSIRAKWADPLYRNKTVIAMQDKVNLAKTAAIMKDRVITPVISRRQ